MNSVNYPDPKTPHEMSKEARVPASLPLSAFVHTNVDAIGGANGKQRAAVSTVVLAVQVILALGVTYGLARQSVVEVPQAVTVNLLPEKEEETKPPPPPMKPMLQTPQITMDVPPPVQIYMPPPLVQTQAPAPPITATTTPPPSNPDAVIETYQQKLLRHLGRFKYYPAGARSRKQQGTVFVRFTMDRDGKVLSVALDKPSPFALLNDEGLAMVNRAQPLPPPPPEMEGNPIELIVPVEFSLKNAR